MLDLCVLFDSSLTFMTLMDHETNKLNAMLEFITSWSIEFDDLYVILLYYGEAFSGIC